MTAKPPVTFSDLPMDVLEKVVKNLDLFDCLVLRKVSRGLRRLVDSSEIHCDRIKIYFWRPYPRIVIEDSEVVYSSASLRRWKHKRIYGKDVKLEEIQKAISDVSTIFKIPKLKIDYFKISGVRIDEFLEFLASLPHQLDVRSINLDAFGRHRRDLSILRYLKPGNLEEIRVNSLLVFPFDFDEITETVQWKMARKLYWNRSPDWRHLEKMMHFKEIEIKDFSFDNENVAIVRDILLKSPHLESGYLQCYDHNSPYLEDEEQVVGILSQDPAYNAENRRFSIPDSRNYFQLEFDNYGGEVSALRIDKIFDI